MIMSTKTFWNLATQVLVILPSLCMIRSEIKCVIRKFHNYTPYTPHVLTSEDINHVIISRE
jgi:hypothetical protein